MHDEKRVRMSHKIKLLKNVGKRGKNEENTSEAIGKPQKAGDRMQW
jgi:hypothetical protein